MSIPRIGMLATVRNRRALITAVDPSLSTSSGRLHLVNLDYTDREGVSQESLIWEYEPNTKLLEPNALPRIADDAPMNEREFMALQRASRWTALSPFLLSDPSSQALSLASPLFGAVQVEDFQLLPLTQALLMPRISLLISDDVGLGKTIEAGLIAIELLLRRRIRRVLVLSPASLRKQWQQEMKSKFSLPFDVVDRAETHALQKRLGLDVNPWRTFPRIITSYHYLKQADVLEQFRAACSQPEGTAQLPWDLLIVDEVHNLMPSNFGRDSDLSEMLRIIAPWFEHKLFLSATPHNGHTRCFTGLLEQLDPVRFTQTSELSQEMQSRIAQVVIRRLKREINQKDEEEGKIPRFGDRHLEPIPLYFGQAESQLAKAFAQFRRAVKSLIASAQKTEQLAGSFALEVLNKRLLSCPYSFAVSWGRFQEGMNQIEGAKASEVQAAKRAVLEDLDDDLETEGRMNYAAKTTGAWLKPLIPHLGPEIDAINQALTHLGLKSETIGDPTIDERWERLKKLVQERLREGKHWKNDERLIVFTEYKSTLDYLQRRLQSSFPGEERIVTLYGGMTDTERETIKQAFNDPDHPIRILVATDAASEGLNLQETARFVFHQDIPWNPAKLDQRNGRLDRHGQARDVIVFHFTSEDDADLKFLGRVVEKVNAIREELGSMEAVFDAAFQRRFEDMEDCDRLLEKLSHDLKQQQGRTQLPRTAQIQEPLADIEHFKQALDLSPETLKSTLDIALGLGIGGQYLEGPDVQGKLRLKMPVPPQWTALIDDCLRLETDKKQLGALPAIAFDPQHFIDNRSERPVFRASKDTVLLHLGHPIFHQALALFARARFPGGWDNYAASRWLIRYGDVPQNADALLLLTVEELAINELREPFHHWLKTLRFVIKNGELGELLPSIPAGLDHAAGVVTDPILMEQVREIWLEIRPDLQKQLSRQIEDLTKQLQTHLKAYQVKIETEEKEKFEARIQEVKKAIAENTIKKLEREREQLLADMRQLMVFPEDRRSQEERLRDIEEELKRRQHHYQKLLDFLQREKTRVLSNLIPKRYQLRGNAQVFPVTVEFRLPQQMVKIKP